MVNLTKKISIDQCLVDNEFGTDDKVGRNTRFASESLANMTEINLFCKMAVCKSHTDNLGNILWLVNKLEIIVS